VDGSPERMTVSRKFPQPVVIRNDQASVHAFLDEAALMARQIEREHRPGGWRLWRSGDFRGEYLTPMELKASFLSEVRKPAGDGHRLDVLVEPKKKRWTIYAVTVVLVRG